MTEQKTQFPVHLRKMWTGAEVQKWLDDHVNAEPIVKYIELDSAQVLEMIGNFKWDTINTGLFKRVINPDWKPKNDA